RSGGNAASAHAQMYTMGTLLKHGSEDQKRGYLPRIAKGQLRLQAFGVTEPEAGSETTRLRTAAVKRGDRYVVNGKKVFISRAEHSDLLLLLARTTPYEELEDKTEGLSILIVDLRRAFSSPWHRRTRILRLRRCSATRQRGFSIGANRVAPKPTWRSCSRRRRRGMPRTRRSTPTAGTDSRRSTTSSASSARPVSCSWRRSATTWCWPISGRTSSACRVRIDALGVRGAAPIAHV